MEVSDLLGNSISVDEGGDPEVSQSFFTTRRPQPSGSPPRIHRLQVDDVLVQWNQVQQRVQLLRLQTVLP